MVVAVLDMLASAPPSLNLQPQVWGSPAPRADIVALATLSGYTTPSAPAKAQGQLS
jgi:hypothetical protein